MDAEKVVDGYTFAKEVISRYGVEKLLECANNAETDWLELKASLFLRPEDAAPGETQQDLNWNIARELIAMCNTRGGVLLVGIDDKAHNPVSLCWPDGTKVDTGSDMEMFIREQVYPALCPDKKQWSVKGNIQWSVRGWSGQCIEINHYLYRGTVVLGIFVRPCENKQLELVATTKRTSGKPQGGEVFFCRKSGVGEIQDIRELPDISKHIEKRSRLLADSELAVKLQYMTENSGGTFSRKELLVNTKKPTIKIHFPVGCSVALASLVICIVGVKLLMYKSGNEDVPPSNVLATAQNSRSYANVHSEELVNSGVVNTSPVADSAFSILRKASMEETKTRLSLFLMSLAKYRGIDDAGLRAVFDNIDKDWKRFASLAEQDNPDRLEMDDIAKRLADMVSSILGRQNELDKLLIDSAGKKESLEIAAGVSLELSWVPGGTFRMGGTMFDFEKPEHDVVLSCGFWIGTTEITQRQWEAVMKSNPSAHKGENFPVENITWYDCLDFINKLNAAQTNWVFRLPTEAEWEFAAKGGVKSKGYKFSGSDSYECVAWFSDNAGAETHPVAQFEPNELGLYDMTGNVYEWCQDWYGYYSAAPSADPKGPSIGQYRCARGGCFASAAGYLGTSCRCCRLPSLPGEQTGMRLVANVMVLAGNSGK